MESKVIEVVFIGGPFHLKKMQIESVDFASDTVSLEYNNNRVLYFSYKNVLGDYFLLHESLNFDVMLNMYINKIVYKDKEVTYLCPMKRKH